MYLKLKNKKLKINEYTKFKERFKSFKFYLKEMNYGIKLPNKKLANTYFFFFFLDICFTDKDDIIIKLIDNVRSEKLHLKLKAKNVYFLPVGTNKNLQLGQKIKLTKK